MGQEFIDASQTPQGVPYLKSFLLQTKYYYQRLTLNDRYYNSIKPLKELLLAERHELQTIRFKVRAAYNASMQIQFSSVDH